MKLVMTLLVRDEEDVLETNIRYHLEQGVDFIVATDNRSVDTTADILHSFEAEGHLKHIFEADDNFDQGAWVTRMARMAAERFGADWIINNDADEFWWPKEGTLKSVLSEIPESVGVLEARRVNFLPRPTSCGTFLTEMTVRDVSSVNALGRPLPSKVCHRAAPTVVVGCGNHSVDGIDRDVFGGPSPIVIFHFPLRSYGQFESKIVHGGRAYERNTVVPEGIGSTWRSLYERWQRGGLPAYYESQVADDDAIAEGLASGSLVVDRRLVNFCTSRSLIAPM